MKIVSVNSRNRRDMYVTYECEHCKHTFDGYAYDDDYFHKTIVPNKVCPKCKKTSDSNYIPLTPKYSANQTV